VARSAAWAAVIVLDRNRMPSISLFHRGVRVATASISGRHVLMANVVHYDVPQQGKPAKRWASLHGLDKNAVPGTSRTWVHVAVEIGDELEIRVAEGDDCDPPVRSHPERMRGPDDDMTEDKQRESIVAMEERIAAVEALVVRRANEPLHRTASSARFEVFVDGVKRFTAGVPGAGMLSLHVKSVFGGDFTEPEVLTSVSGMDSDVEELFYNWPEEALRVPAVVRVVVLGPGEVDPPATATDRPPGSDEYIAYLRDEFLEPWKAELAAMLDKK